MNKMSINSSVADGDNELVLKKVEPWNSVRVTFNIPREAALRLKQLAEQGNHHLRQLGVLGVQIEGDRLVSLTVQTPGNQRAELIIRTHDGPQSRTSGPPDHSGPISSTGAPLPMPPHKDDHEARVPNMDITRKNIEEYLRQFSSALPSGAPSGAGPNNLIRPTQPIGAFKPNLMDNMPGPSGLSTKSVFSGGSQGIPNPSPGQHRPPPGVMGQPPRPPHF